MDEKAREARRAYKREWNRKNRDKVKAAQDRYWARKAAQIEAAKNSAEEARQDEGQRDIHRKRDSTCKR